MGSMNRTLAIRPRRLFCRSPELAPEAFQSGAVELAGRLLRRSDSLTGLFLGRWQQPPAGLVPGAADPQSAPRRRLCPLISPPCPVVPLARDFRGSPGLVPPTTDRRMPSPIVAP